MPTLRTPQKDKVLHSCVLNTNVKEEHDTFGKIYKIKNIQYKIGKKGALVHDMMPSQLVKINKTA